MLVEISEALVTTEREEEAPASGRRRKSEAAPRLSELLWGIRWDDLLPLECAAGVTVHSVSYDEAMSFVRAHYKDIFPSVPGSPFGRIETSPAKERYYRHAADFFEFRKDDESVAILICDPIDWGSYYIRSAAALPDHHGHAAIQRFFPFLFEALSKAGVERVEAEAAPTNATSVQHLTRLGFRISGTLMTERWGALVRLVKFLSEPAEATFVQQFCATTPPHRRAPTRSAGPA